MRKDDFSMREDKIISEITNAIDVTKRSATEGLDNSYNLSGAGNQSEAKGFQRIYTAGKQGVNMQPQKDDMLDNFDNSYGASVNNNNAVSYVLIIFAVIALIAVVAIVAMNVINSIKPLGLS